MLSGAQIKFQLPESDSARDTLRSEFVKRSSKGVLPGPDKYLKNSSLPTNGNLPLKSGRDKARSISLEKAAAVSKFDAAT
jgi:hypothetical protein